MRYHIKQDQQFYSIKVEASFTLIDYMLLFASALGTVFFALFSVLFFGTVFVKLFTQHEFVFDKDRYEMTQYLRLFNYLRFKRHVLSYGDINKIVLTNAESGNALSGRGFLTKEWFTIDIVTPTKVHRIAKAEEDELEETYELYYELQEELGELLSFEVDIVEVD